MTISLKESNHKGPLRSHLPAKPHKPGTKHPIQRGSTITGGPTIDLRCHTPLSQ